MLLMLDWDQYMSDDGREATKHAKWREFISKRILFVEQIFSGDTLRRLPPSLVNFSLCCAVCGPIPQTQRRRETASPRIVTIRILSVAIDTNLSDMQ